MNPTTPYMTGSEAERIIFGYLSQVFVDKPWIAMHSVLLHHHPEKRFGEADFLLCTTYGLYVLEIKGGRVSCQSGRWTYQDKYGNIHEGGSPFHQAHTALQGLRQILIEHFGVALVNTFCLGYGVILTDTCLPDYALNTAEYQKAMLCHGGEHRHLQKWLKNLLRYWHGRNQAIMPIAPIGDEQLLQIAQFIRPDFIAPT